MAVCGDWWVPESRRRIKVCVRTVTSKGAPLDLHPMDRQEAALTLTLRSKLDKLTVSSSFSLRFLFCSNIRIRTGYVQKFNENSNTFAARSNINVWITAQNSHNNMEFHVWGRDRCTLTWRCCFQHWLTRLKSHGVPGVRKVKELPLCSGGLQEMRQISKGQASTSLQCDSLAHFIFVKYSAEDVSLFSIDKKSYVQTLAAETRHKQQVKAFKHFSHFYRECFSALLIWWMPFVCHFCSSHCYVSNMSDALHDDWGTLIFKTI